MDIGRRSFSVRDVLAALTLAVFAAVAITIGIQHSLFDDATGTCKAKEPPFASPLSSRKAEPFVSLSSNRPRAAFGSSASIPS